MELTEKILKDRLEELRKKQGTGDLEILARRWLEKGVECGIIMPMLEIVLEYDPINDIKFESSSREYNKQRFDFLINDEFIIEAKKLGENLSKNYKQVSEYLKNSHIKLAIITNGIDFEIFINKHIVEEERGESIEEKYVTNNNLIKVMSLSYIEDVNDFLKSISIFSKSNFGDSVSKIIKYICAHIGTKGYKKNVKIALEKKIDNQLKRNIENSVKVEERGFYSDMIATGKLHSGDILCFDNYDSEGVKIYVMITDSGNIKILLDKCDYNIIKARKSGYEKISEIFDKWISGSEILYQHPGDIIKELKGNKRRSGGIENLFQKIEK